MTLICQLKRLNVRQFTLDDVPFIVELLNEASFIRYMLEKLGFRLQRQIILYGHSNNLYQYTRA
ncbi:hypothetical protein [Salinivibrio kushneri]|uniref:hypothetical protein n=1 Tax=Salinivibrio kushneri TaxID=1908198 RepID=UPI0009886464|nr:hypothetical protein [Salinivibrio kushneri]OOE32571.1 hypothetical protein BZG04_15020 [Salinivibrio kushneri]OOE50573.1 hypothetical protein BZG12_13850 [Salinivibrio kushneri]